MNNFNRLGSSKYQMYLIKSGYPHRLKTVDRVVYLEDFKTKQMKKLYVK